MMTTLSDLVSGWFNTLTERLSEDEINREVAAFQRCETEDNGLVSPRWSDDEVYNEMVAQNDESFPTEAAQ